jgi:hypothetical protein
MSLIVGMMRGRRRKVRGWKGRRGNMSKPTGTMKVTEKRKISPPSQLHQPRQWRAVIGRQRRVREREKRRRKEVAAVAVRVKRKASQKKRYLHLRRSRGGFK